MDARTQPSDSTSAAGKKMPVWKGLLVALSSVALLFGACEAVLAIAGVEPVSASEDPFVGFSGNFPLFVEETASDGSVRMATAANKRSLFNAQSFPRQKGVETFRIFCMGGSTTFGRPYEDPTSFCGWLRELLPRVDGSRQWEVINAGGVSYASYRVARLMEELSEYEPDLFVIYTGHNEFLEERTYRELKARPGFVRSIAGVFARTRSYAAMRGLLQRAGAVAEASRPAQNRLPGEVDTLLEHYGPGAYERDDALRGRIVRHFGESLRKMIRIGERAGARVVFVTPASSAKDCLPFKSQHTDGLADAAREQATGRLDAAREAVAGARWPEALAAADAGLAVDPRHAELHYRRAQALLGLRQVEQAAFAFERALVEDVCPLRALPELEGVLRRIAVETGTPMVDFVRLLRDRMQREHGHAVPGREYFLDHVHPTIAGNGLLAMAIVDELVEQGVARADADWRARVFAPAEAAVLARLDIRAQAQGLANLASVLAWSGKTEDASRPALAALELGVDDPKIVVPAASIVATWHAMEGRARAALKYHRVALNAAPGNPELHLRFALWVLDRGVAEPELAAGHLLYASVFWRGERRDEVLALLGRTVAELSMPDLAYAELLQAREVNPQSAELAGAVESLRSRLGDRAVSLVPAKIEVGKYPSGAIRHIVEVRPGPNGDYVPHGLMTEWYEGGELMSFGVHRDGRLQGALKRWQRDAAPALPGPER